jgi:hypothetical protein
MRKVLQLRLRWAKEEEKERRERRKKEKKTRKVEQEIIPFVHEGNSPVPRKSHCLSREE